MDRDDKYGESPAPTPAESNNSIDEILFNPNVFTECKLAGSPEVSLRTTVCLLSLSRFKQHSAPRYSQEIAADEALVKKVGSYLLDTVIPKFVQDLCSLDVSPMDGQTLTDVLHSNGINVRYLGKVSLFGLILLKLKTWHHLLIFL
jgi:protein TIF31